MVGSTVGSRPDGNVPALDTVYDAEGRALVTSDVFLARLAAAGLGVVRQTLHNRAQRHEVAPPDWPRPAGKVGGRTLLWRVAEVDAYIAAQSKPRGSA